MSEEPWQREQRRGWNEGLASVLSRHLWWGFGFYGLGMGIAFREFWPADLNWGLVIFMLVVAGLGLIWEGARHG